MLLIWLFIALEFHPRDKFLDVTTFYNSSTVSCWASPNDAKDARILGKK